MAFFRTEIRIQIIGLIFLIAVSAVIGKLWIVQVLQGKAYADKIKGNSQVTVRIPSVRGEIRDRDGVPLVTNRASYEVDFYLQEMVNGYKQAFGAKQLPTRAYRYTYKGVAKETRETDINKVVQDTVMPRLQELGFDEEYNAASLQLHYRNDTLVPFTFMEDLDFEDMAKLSERDLGLPGVEVAVRPVRQYLFGSLAAHLLGYVGPVSTDKKEIKEDAKNYTFYQADVEGKNNVEASMDKWLRGQPGVRYVKRNPKGVLEGDTGVTPPTPGANVYLTIDARIQTIAEEALRVAGRGAAVVVDPSNGNVLAMASVPSFDPNTFIPSIKAKDWQALRENPANPLINRAISAFPPGSTFKLVTALAGLRKGLANQRFDCGGGVSYGDHFFHCWISEKGG
ncbi:MAG: penicillin-binding protein 2, partial [Verrucomicrobia bacterium]|nr:penicillin-binding protein 2 [Verrucomicrobiota bacterium]